MATNILFRRSINPPVPTATTVKGSPLTSMEFDGNFKSVKDAIDNILLNGIGSVLARHGATATAGQTVFNLPFVYSPGTNNLLVFVNGSLVERNVDYTETTTQVVTFNSGLELGQEVTFLTNISPSPGLTYAAAGVSSYYLATNGVQTAFTLPVSVLSKNNTQIFNNGVYQVKDSYAIAGTSLLFDEAPAAGHIEITVIAAMAIGQTTADLVGYQPATGAPTNVETALRDLEEIYEPSGSSLVGYLPAGAGAVATDVQTKLRESVSVKDFGAVGDGVADDTAAIQAAINALPDGYALDGFNAVYVVTSLNLKSNIAMTNFQLKTKAGTSDFVAPITINGKYSAKTNIFLFNVSIDGNRSNQTNITSPTEDGGRHGFRVLGFVSNLTLQNCSAVYCAGDGLELFSGGVAPASDAPSGLCFQNITIRDCTFNWNRRHGISGDSFNNVKFLNVTALNNGLDLNTVDPITVGTRGARSDGTLGGTLYAGPVDIEGYGVGTGIQDFQVIGGVFTGSPSGFTIQDSVSPVASGFVKRNNIIIYGAHFSYAAYSGTNGCFQILGQSGTAATPTYDTVSVDNCQFDHYMKFEGIEKLNVSGGTVVANFFDGLRTNYAALANCKDWRFNVSSNRAFVFYDALPFTVTRTILSGSPTIVSELTQLIGFTPNGYLVRYYSTLNGAVANNYWMRFAVNSGYLIRLVNSYLVNTAVPSADLCVAGDGSSDNRSMTNFSVVFNLTSTANRNLELVYEVVNNS